jgi:hypothetical protein
LYDGDEDEYLNGDGRLNGFDIFVFICNRYVRLRDERCFGFFV